MKMPKTEFPNDVDLEKRLLSAMMMKGGAVVPLVADILSVEDFYRPEHQMIYKAIIGASNKHGEINDVHVSQELEASGDMKKVGHTFFAILRAYEFTTAYVKDYAATIKELSRQRQLIQAAETLYEKATSGLTANEIIAQAEKIFSPMSEEKQSAQRTAVDIASEAYQRAQDLSRMKGLSGVDTGFKNLNDITNGLQRGELILLAARPSMGKTALALNIAANAAQKGNVVALYSLEMSAMQIGIRLLSSESKVAATKIQTGKNLTESDHRELVDSITDIEKMALYVDDTSGLSVANLRTKLRRMKKEHGLDLVVIDYLQLMRGVGENRVQEISEISRGLKALAKEFDVPVLALSQLSRQVELRAEKRPQLSDLRDSGSLEQDADIVMFLYREEYYYRDEAENENLAEVIVAKNRNGATASIKLFFDKSTMYFGNLFKPSRGEAVS